MTIQERIKAAQSTRKKNDTYGKESSQGSDVARQSVSAQPSSTAASSAVPKLDLYGMALDALRSGTLPATTQFGRVNLPTGAAAFRANQRQETAQALDDRKREDLEAERYRLTQPGRVYNEEVTAQNRARVQEIDQELSTLLPEKSGRLKSGLQSILATGAASFPVIADTFSQLNKNTGTRRDSFALDQLTKVNQQIRALENGRTGDALSYIRSQDQWKVLDQQRTALNQQLQSILSTPVSLDAPGMQMMRRANQDREQALEGLEGVPRFLGETALSIGQNAALLPLAAVNPAAPLAAMGAISSADRMYELSERGLPASEALGRGLISGGIEAATEKIPLDNLMDVIKNGGKGAIRNILKQMGTEATEESVSYITNYIVDKAYQDPEAEFSWAELAQAAAGGALSGGVFGAAGTGINALSNYAYGKSPSFSEGASTVQEQRQSSAAAQLAQEMAQEQINQFSRQAQLSDLWQTPADKSAVQETETVPGYGEAQQVRPSAQTDMLQTEQTETAGQKARQTRSYLEIQSQTAALEHAPERKAASALRERGKADELISTLGENGQKAFRSVYQENSDLPASFREFLKAYNQGLSGAAETDVEQGRYINTQAAYYAGQNDAAASLVREKQTAQFAQTAGKGSGLVYDDYVDSTLDTETADKVNSVAKLLGVRVQFVDSVREGTANAQISGSDVLVEKNNPNPVMFLLGHEWTHRLQETAPVEYRKFRDLVSEEVSGEAKVILDQYRNAGESITYETALDEAAANYAGRMIDDGAVLDDFIQRHRTDRTLLEKIRDAIRTIISKLTGAERRQAQTAEGKLSAAMEAANRQSDRLQRNGNSDKIGPSKNSMKENVEYGREDEAHTGIDGNYQGETRDGDQRAGSEDQGVFGELSSSSGRYRKVDPSFGQTPARSWANGNTVEPESGSAVYAEQQTVMEYGVPSFVVSDQAWEQNFGENAPPAVTSEGQIYFRQTIPEKKRGMIAPHELTHAMRQADYAPYLEFVEKTPDMLNLNDPMTKLLLDYVAKHQNTSFSDTDPVRLYDEFNATIYGHISAGMSEMFESGGPAEGVFRDFQAYSSELSRIHELFKRENGADFFGNDQSPRLSRKGTEEARELAKVQEENDLLRERVDYWRGQTRRTKQITTDKKSVDRAARDLWAAYAGNKLPLDTKKEEPANNP